MAEPFFAVWNGHAIGVHADEAALARAVEGFDDPRWAAFPSPEAAVRAFTEGPREHAGPRPSMFPAHAIAVDAACAGNPGPTEYRGVALHDGQQLFHRGPMAGTNNLGEFLGLVHGLAWLSRLGTEGVVWTDSKVAMDWVRRRAVGSTLPRTSDTEPIWHLVQRALRFLRAQPKLSPVLKWPTSIWGEIPADFGRK